MKIGGRILSVGAIGEMDAMVAGTVKGLKESLRIPARELTLGGFLVYNPFDKILEAERALSAMLAEGKLRGAEAVVHAGVE